MNIETLLAVLGYSATIFSLGYMLGQNHAKNRNDRS